jgi:ABC-type lipoprotein release transport system permease subunit
MLNFVTRMTGHNFFPPKYYFFSELPAKIVWGDLMFVLGVSILLATISGIIPALRAITFSPATALRD